MRHTPVEKDLEVDVSVASLRASVYANSNSDNFGLVLHRKHIDECYPMLPEYPLSPGYVCCLHLFSISKIFIFRFFFLG